MKPPLLICWPMPPGAIWIIWSPLRFFACKFRPETVRRYRPLIRFMNPTAIYECAHSRRLKVCPSQARPPPTNITPAADGRIAGRLPLSALSLLRHRVRYSPRRQRAGRRRTAGDSRFRPERYWIFVRWVIAQTIQSAEVIPYQIDAVLYCYPPGAGNPFGRPRAAAKKLR